MEQLPELLPRIENELSTPSSTPIAMDRLIKAVIHSSTLKVDILLVLIFQVTSLIVISFLLNASAIGLIGITLRTAIYAYGIIALFSLLAMGNFLIQWFKRDELE